MRPGFLFWGFAKSNKFLVVFVLLVRPFLIFFVLVAYSCILFAGGLVFWGLGLASLCSPIPFGESLARNK